MKQEIIELQNKAINKLYHLSLSGKDKITLKAPTGSGKTYMMSSFMNKMLDNNKNIVFIVSTLSKGKLANQSYESFENLSLVKFKNLKPFLISSGNENNKNQEYSLHNWHFCKIVKTQLKK
ncbi:DEAD/DEAH box helicase family protein [Campylobacter coli]|nr:DEAD/DEAH box helicase family protein [Campylobacter coli]